jgi:transmembrane sensor
MKERSDISAIDLLIGKYLSGNATPNEVKEFLHWLEGSSQNREYYAQSQMLWLNSENIPQGENQNRWEQLQLKMQEREAKNLEKEMIILDSRKKINRFIRIAATILFLLGVSNIFFFMNRSKSASDFAQSILEVPYGSRSTFTLPDGTKLWVNSGSKLTYNNGYGKSNRDIDLTGEAYFDVTKNRKLPFIVHALNLKIKALGTSFNVKAYPDERKVETTLVHGLVEIEKAGSKSPFLLRPSQKITISEEEVPGPIAQNENKELLQKKRNVSSIDTGSTVILTKEIDTNKETSWKEGKLIFDREPLSSLTVKLERRYDVHFSFENEKLREYKYTGTFGDLSLEQIMEAMRFSSPLDFVIKEKNVFLKEKRKLL